MNEKFTQIMSDSGILDEIRKNLMLESLIKRFYYQKKVSEELIIDKIARRIFHGNSPAKKMRDPIFNFTLENMTMFSGRIREIFNKNEIEWYFEDKSGSLYLDSLLWFISFLVAIYAVRIAIEIEE